MGALPEKLSDIFDLNLNEWKIGEVFLLELDHGLMGFFPAITKHETVIIVRDKKLLKPVWEILPRRKAKITKLLAICHSRFNFGFNIAAGEDTESFCVFTETDIQALVGKTDSVMWASGILSLRNEVVVDPDFDS